MSFPDLVRSTLARPMDWSQFERLVCEILQQDDLPSLQKIGGQADEGIDGIDEVLYGDQIRVRAVVQITSQR